MARKVSKKFKITVSVIVVIIFLTLFNYFIRVRLILAAGENDYKTVKTILNIYPLAINQRESGWAFDYLNDFSNNTPLVEACIKNRTEIIKLLVERGADINKRTHGSISYPLIAVLINGNYEMAWYLIEHGADVLVSNYDIASIYSNSVPEAILSGFGTFSKQDKEQQYELMKYVIEKGASLDPSHENYSKAYLLYKALMVDNSRVVEYLIQNGYFDVDIILDAPDKNYNRTSLIFALRLEVYDRNRDNDDPNAEKTDGSRDTYGMCETLLKLGADKTLKDIDGKTALDYAIELGDEKLISLLSD